MQVLISFQFIMCICGAYSIKLPQPSSCFALQVGNPTLETTQQHLHIVI